MHRVSTISAEARASHCMAEELPCAKSHESDDPEQRLNSLSLLHELEVHQIELEMQSAERQHTRDNLEPLLTKCSKLYAFAPSGYFTLDCDGTISSVNLAGAGLIGVERSLLIGESFHRFVSDEYRSDFLVFHTNVVENQNTSASDILLHTAGRHFFYVRIQAVFSVPGDEYLLAVTDITKKKLSEEALLRSKTSYRSLFENMLEGFAYCKILYDAQGRPTDFVYLDVNDTFKSLTGLENVTGKTASEVIPGIKMTNPELFEIYERVAATGNPEKFNIELEPLGKWFSVSVFSVEREYFVAVFANITEQKEALDKLQLMAQVFEHIGEAIVISGPDNRIVATNGAFTRLTGYSQEEVLGRNPRILKSGHEPKEFYESMWERLLNENYWQGEIWEKRKDGTLYPKWLTITVVRNDRREITHYIGSFSDISERKQVAQKIDYLAHHDHLTNLPNRFCLMKRLSLALEEAKKTTSHLAVMFIDLDRFKSINDSFGHHTGDSLLLLVAERLQGHVRKTDIVARIGGDEFVVVLPQIQSGTAAVHVASNIREVLSRNFLIDGNDLHITPSIGISVFPHDGKTPEDLIKNAGYAMSFAKSKGRNSFQFFKRKMNSSAQARLSMESALRAAIGRDELLLHYQPQIDLTSGRVIGVEALVRWQHPHRGLIPPDMFIPIAEDTGLIMPIGDFVLKTACRQLNLWLSEGLPQFRMAVNLSA